MQQPGYFERKYVPFPNGHASVGSMQVKYDKYEGGEERIGWPGLAAGGWILVDIFPGMTFNLRTSVLRIDTAIPLGPNEVMIELRGPEEGMTIHDEGGMRHFYAEWSRRMGRAASDPFGERGRT